MKSLTVLDRIEYAAQGGAYEIHLFVWNNTAKKLRREGLVLTETNIHSERKGEKYLGISWKDAKVEIPEGPFDVDNMVKQLRKENVALNHANVLWLMAEDKNRRSKE